MATQCIPGACAFAIQIVQVITIRRSTDRGKYKDRHFYFWQLTHHLGLLDDEKELPAGIIYCICRTASRQGR